MLRITGNMNRLSGPRIFTARWRMTLNALLDGRRIDCANGETRARGSAEGAKAAPADIRDGNHRALSPARENSVEQALIDTQTEQKAVTEAPQGRGYPAVTAGMVIMIFRS
jgi:hypothetical protein